MLLCRAHNLMNRYARYSIIFVVLEILMLACAMHGAHVSPDSYYYWAWTKHLAWSYYDGPPMIAYSLYLITHIFGNSEIALMILGWGTLAIVSYFIYHSALMLFHQPKIGFYSVVGFGILTGNMHHFIITPLYDSVLMIFWGGTIYSFLKLITTRKTRYYYQIGIMIGCMLLSKYTGILLCVSLLLACLFYAPYRFVLTSRHFYAALGIAFLLFLPVLAWNQAHDWISFSYQWQHGFHHIAHPWNGLLNYVMGTVFDFNILLLVFLSLVFYEKAQSWKSPNTGLLLFITLVPLLFFLISAFHSATGTSWTAPMAYTMILFTVAALNQLPLRNITFIFLALIALLPTVEYIVLIRLPVPNNISIWQEGYIIAKILPNTPLATPTTLPIYTSEYYFLPAYLSYFLPYHPKVYSTNLFLGKQFYLWTQEHTPPKPGSLVWFVSTYAPIQEPHMTDCHLTFQEPATATGYQGFTWSLYVWQCRYSAVNVPVSKF